MSVEAWRPSSSAAGAASDASPGHLPGEASMWFFIVGDLFIFGLYFVSYLYFRGQDATAFLESQQHLNQGIGAFNTLVLLTSSLFVALGVGTAREGKTAQAFKLLLVAIACGAVFPIVKAFEWMAEFDAGFTPGFDTFFMYYYLLAGMHLCHVLLGLVILGFIAHDLKTSPKPSIAFAETGASYWHMVDLLWVLLFALLYVMR